MRVAADRLKLLLVVHSIDHRGGMEVQLAHLASGLARRGHRVRIASLRSRPDAGQVEGRLPLDPRVEVFHLGATGRAAGIGSLRRLIGLARASDLVHCTGWDASLWGRLAAIAARRPVVVAEHTPGREHQVSASGAPRGSWIARHNRLLDPFTSATVICALWQRDLLRGEGVADDKISYIANGVPVQAIESRSVQGLTRESLGIPASAKVVAHVARFAPQKRQDLTLRTVAALREELGDVRVVFAGDGPELESVKALADELSADWAIFLGTYDNVPSVFRIADIAVLPSTGEGLPMAILEAVAVRVPVVATDVGDIGPFLRETGAGVVVPPGAPEDFLMACRRVLEDGALHAEIVEAATTSAASIDSDVMVGRYDDLLAGLARVEAGADAH